MATPSGVRPPPPLNLKDSPVEGWILFKQGWGNYIIITDLAQKENKYQKAMFLHCIGPEALKVYNTFNLPEDDSTKLKDIVQKFEEFIIGETNETHERYKFNQRTQKPAKSTDQFVTALKTLSATCNFCDCMRETLIRDRLVTGINSPETRKKLLEQRKLSLQNAIDICRAMESRASQLKDMDYTRELLQKQLIKFSRKVSAKTLPKTNSGLLNKIVNSVVDTINLSRANVLHMAKVVLNVVTEITSPRSARGKSQLTAKCELCMRNPTPTPNLHLTG